MNERSKTTKRIMVGMPIALYAALEDWAEEEGRPVANIAAYQLEQAIRIKYPDRFPPPIEEKHDRAPQ